MVGGDLTIQANPSLLDLSGLSALQEIRGSLTLGQDDALSAVDTGTETMILEALKRRRRKHTTIVIAHRLSTLMHADRVLVLDSGKVIQEGTHESLSAVDGLYLCGSGVHGGGGISGAAGRNAARRILKA